MSKIASNTDAAVTAVVDIKSISITEGESVNLAKSNVSSMTIGTEVSNTLLLNISELIDCVQKQSEKFPQIAELMQSEDNQITFEGCE